jgi:tRNA A37 threonylcarbamoyladenosine synthetase subunit TsaC/SUA5/YrdC
VQIIQLSHLETIQAKQDAIFLYPTDSLYGLGAIATMENTARINDIKKRLANKHFSLIAPTFSWILEHFVVEKDIDQKRSERSQQYGPITVLCKRKNPGFLSWVSSNEYIGIRYL